MALNFPNPANPGDIYNADNGILYTYDGVKWIGSVPPANPFDQSLNTTDSVTFEKVTFSNFSSEVTDYPPGGDIQFNHIPVTTVTGSGSGATVTITYAIGDTVYTVSNGYGGSDYAIGDQVLVTGDLIGGTTPANDCIIEITALYPSSTVVFDAGYVSGVPVAYIDGLHFRTNGNEWTLSEDGKLILPGGSSLVPDLNSVHLYPGVDGYSSLTSYDRNQNIWVDNNGSYITTDLDADIHQWTFDRSGNLSLPAFNSSPAPISSTGIVFGDGTFQSTAYTGVLISNVAPTAPHGAVWFNSADGRAYIKYNDIYVDLSPTVVAPASVYTGNLDIVENTITNLDADNKFIDLTPDLNPWRFTEDSVTSPYGKTLSADLLGNLYVSGNSKIRSTNSSAYVNFDEDSGGVQISTDAGETVWAFLPGNFLYLPGESTLLTDNGLKVVSPQGTLRLGNLDENTINTHFHIRLDNPLSSELFLGDDEQFVKLAYTGDVIVQSRFNTGADVYIQGANAVEGDPWGSGDVYINGGTTDYNPDIGSTTYQGGVYIDTDKSHAFLDGNEGRWDIGSNTNGAKIYNRNDSISDGTLDSVTIVTNAPDRNYDNAYFWRFNNDGTTSLPSFTITADDGLIGQTLVTDGEGVVTWQSPVAISDTAPATTDGTMWFNSIEGRTYVKYNGVWADMNPTVIAPPETYLDDITIQDNTIGTRNAGEEIVIDTDVVVTGNIVPQANVVFNLGSLTRQWNSLYVSSNSIYIDGHEISVVNGGLLLNGQTPITEMDGGNAYSA